MEPQPTSGVDSDELKFNPQETYTPGVKPNRSGIGKMRWAIAILLFFGVLINYIDRSSIAVAEGDIRADFGLTAGQMGIVLSSFGWSYVLMQIPAGLLLDKIGIKWVFRVATIMWSVSCFLTAIISGTGLLIFARIVLGLSESPVFPGAMKATGYWFPRSERGTATAIFDSGQRLSNVIGFPLVAMAVVSFGWRGAFVAMGVLSLIYVFIFFWKYRDPKEMNRLGKLKDSELEYIRKGGAQDEDAPRPNPLANLGYILKQRKVWGMSIGLGCAGYTQWMLLTWLPGYLQSEMGMSIMSSGIFTALPWLIAVAVEFIFPRLDARPPHAPRQVRHCRAQGVHHCGHAHRHDGDGCSVHRQSRLGTVLDHLGHERNHHCLLRHELPSCSHRPRRRSRSHGIDHELGEQPHRRHGTGRHGIRRAGHRRLQRRLHHLRSDPGHRHLLLHRGPGPHRPDPHRRGTSRREGSRSLSLSSYRAPGGHTKRGPRGRTHGPLDETGSLDTVSGSAILARASVAAIVDAESRSTPTSA